VDGVAHPCRLIGKIETLANIALDAAEYPFRDVWRLSAPTARPGHSGALIFRPTPRGPVGAGVLFAGIAGSEAWAISADLFDSGIRILLNGQH
jgi:hypothetical protein